MRLQRIRNDGRPAGRRWRARGVAVALVGLLVAVPAWALPSAWFASAPDPSGPGVEAALAAYPDGEILRGLVEDSVVDGVSPDLLAELLVRGAESGIPAATLKPAFTRFHDAATAALPTDPLIGRYLQGLAKGIPVGRIDAVAAELQGRLVAAARQIDALCPHLDRPGREADRLQAIDHAAYALSVGVEPEVLDQSLGLVADADAPYDDVRAPILALSLLVSAGIEGERSFEVVQTAWQHGLRGGDLERLGESVARLGQSGQEPGEVVAHVLGLLEQEVPAETILKDLDTLQADPTEGTLSPGPAGDHPTRRRVPGDRPDSQSRDSFGGSPRMTESSSGGR